MRSVFHTARDIGIGIVSAWAVRELTPHVVLWITEQKLKAEQRKDNMREGNMDAVFDAESIDLSHLGPVKAVYHPKDIHVEALNVTRENIGKLSLEFEAELWYADGGLPFFRFDAKRFDNTQPDGQQPPVTLHVRLNDWILALWGELHIYRDVEFTNTFIFEENGRHGVTPEHLGGFMEQGGSFPPGTFSTSGGIEE
jgi:hypothetical protein